ncbi:MAG: T9SS type A sorting domain-containing protein [Bacteroidetes bacterium]|nr:T9SS type A sorting domain-containing protein [Bacteroidota bacterium]
MKKLLLFIVKKLVGFNLLLWGITYTSNAQSLNFEWVNQVAGLSILKSTTQDVAGNVYAIGRFNNTVDMDPSAGVFNLTSIGGTDVFISKFDAFGNLVWAKQFGSNGNDDGYNISVDAVGNILTTGYFQFTSDFDPGPAIYNLVSVGSTDIFVLSLDASGNFIWSFSLGGTASDYGLSATVDHTGDIIVTGQFASAVDFDPGPAVFTLNSLGGADVFILKINSTGNFIWAKSIGGIFSDFGNSITVDGSNNILITGYFAGTVDFNPTIGVFNLTSVSSTTDIFQLKLDLNGNFQWAIAYGNPGFDFGASISTDGFANVYSTGMFTGTIDFDPGPGVFNLTASGSGNAYITKLDAAGNLIWAKSISGTSTSAGSALCITGSNDIYCTGTFLGTSDLDPGIGISTMTSLGSSDVYIIKLDQNGNFVWGNQFGNLSSDNSLCIFATTFGNLLLTGSFGGTVDFNPGVGVYNLTAVAVQSGYIVKFNQSSPLPIELLSFDGMQSQEKIELKWTTQSEKNNEYFTIEKKSQLNEWITINKVNGAGTSHTQKNYQSFDERPIVGIQYYRLKQVDYNGTYSYSKIIAVDFKSKSALTLSIFPNPAIETIVIKLEPFFSQENYTLRILDACGRVIINNSIITPIIDIDIALLEPGGYLAEVVSGNQIHRQKFIKK